MPELNGAAISTAMPRRAHSGRKRAPAVWSSSV
jgi:hypothetical protein